MNPNTKAKSLMSTREAMSYLGCTLNTLKKYLKTPFGPDGHILQAVTLDGCKYYSRETLDKLKQHYDNSGNSTGRRGGTSKLMKRRSDTSSQSAATLNIATLDPDDGFVDEDGDDGVESVGTPPPRVPQSVYELYTALGLPENAPVKIVVQALQKHVIDVILQRNVLQTYLDDLDSHDWKARHAAADRLLGLVMPKAKSVEVIHADSEEKKEREERALDMLDDIRQQIQISRQRSVAALPRVIEVEAVSSVGSE